MVREADTYPEFCLGVKAAIFGVGTAVIGSIRRAREARQRVTAVQVLVYCGRAVLERVLAQHGSEPRKRYWRHIG